MSSFVRWASERQIPSSIVDGIALRPMNAVASAQAAIALDQSAPISGAALLVCTLLANRAPAKP